MGMRAAVFDRWVAERLAETAEPVVIHLGCGMVSRIVRAGRTDVPWYDVDFPTVIAERKRYYAESEKYHMLAADIREPG